MKWYIIKRNSKLEFDTRKGCWRVHREFSNEHEARSWYNGMRRHYYKYHSHILLTLTTEKMIRDGAHFRVVGF